MGAEIWNIYENNCGVKDMQHITLYKAVWKMFKSDKH
jgi:hypothetical protein